MKFKDFVNAETTKMSVKRDMKVWAAENGFELSNEDLEKAIDDVIAEIRGGS